MKERRTMTWPFLHLCVHFKVKFCVVVWSGVFNVDGGFAYVWTCNCHQ